MRNLTNIIFSSVFLLIFLVAGAQEGTLDDRDLQYFRTPGKKGVNVFETTKENTVEWDGVKVRLGGDFAMVFQGLDHSNEYDDGSGGDGLTNLSNNFSLPTANMNIDVQLEDGLRMHIRTYLSSRHHTEAYVKGGYLQMDKLDFISPGFLEGLMESMTIRVGMDEINYGDAHFRRSDNALSIYNPFVGNYIMDAFTTEPFMEFTYQSNGIIGVFGITNGRLNQSPTSEPAYGGVYPDTPDNGHVLFAKAGYDNQETDGTRFRLTGSIYTSSDQGNREYLYNGDRAGARYYELFDGASDFTGRFNPNFPYQTAIQINPFVKTGGLEFFGIFETVSNGDDAVGGSFTQLGAELLYRFGTNERVYIGGRYNSVSGEAADDLDTQEISRINAGLGFFMTDNVIIKLEYVSQMYDGDGWVGTVYEEGEFNGFNVEAAISF